MFVDIKEADFTPESKFMFAFVRLIAIILLAAVAGAASVHFGFFPGVSLSNAFSGLQALEKQVEQQQNPYNGGTVYFGSKDRGVTVHNPDQTLDGYTVLVMGHGDNVLLLDMAGEAAHEWRVNYHEIWDNSGDVQNPVPERFVFIRKAKVYPDGRLLLIFSAWSTTPYGYGIAMVDRESNVLWKDFRFIHHSFDQASDGTIYALDQHIEMDVRARYPEVVPPYLDDGIAVYSPDGEFLKRFSLLDSIHESPFADAVTLLAASNTGQGFGDALHANDVDVLDASMAERFAFAEAGDLLISLRELDALVIVDPETELAKWFQKGYWHRQHDGDFLPNGNMLVFDNHVLATNAEGNRMSRVIEFDPVSMEIVWEYKQAGGGKFFTTARGSQQRLENGNTLITESDRARILEVTPEGEIAWLYTNAVRLGDDEKRMPAVFWAERYTSQQLPFLAP